MRHGYEHEAWTRTYSRDMDIGIDLDMDSLLGFSTEPGHLKINRRGNKIAGTFIKQVLGT